MVEILRTKKQKEADQYPTRLEVLREYHKRHALDAQYQEELARLEAGHLGEMRVLEYLKEFGLPHWKVIQNIWLESRGIFECDLLLITGENWVPIEIKHYAGQYALENSQWRCYGKVLPNNPISQAQKVFIQFKNLAHENQLPVQTKGSILFTGDHFTLNVVDQVADLDILTLNQLRDVIRDLAWKEKKAYKKDRITADIMNVLNTHETTNPFSADDLFEERGSNLRKGVKCSHCGSFNIQFQRHYISCPCGLHEPHEMAIVRTICEYGVIHFTKNLTTTQVTNFFNGDYAKPTIRNYLNKHFKRYGHNKGTHYQNAITLLGEMEEPFHFDRPKYFVYPY